MKKIRRILYKISFEITSSIAFYPTLIAVGFLLFSFLIMSVEYDAFILDFKEDIRILLVQGVENARLILGTAVGSIISLMVFSFSMVMVVLNRASSTLSPRVIPGLITNKAHQVVLGMYLGTIIYSLILIINIQSADAEYQIPSLGILFSMVFVIICLGLFVYFIHSISRAIQVDNILDSIYRQTKEQLEEVEIKGDIKEVPKTDDWQVLYTKRAGYLKQMKENALIKICSKHDLVIEVMEQSGFFMVKGYPFLRINKKIDEDVEEDIRSCFIFYAEEHVSDHYLFGFKQISEIAVKALSPGINDPGTAIKAIDLLSILYIKKMTHNERRYLENDDGEPVVIIRQLPLEYLLYFNLTPIREYGKEDATVMLNLLESMKNLAYADKDQFENQQILEKYTKSIVASCQKNIHNMLDVEQLNAMIDRVNEFLHSDHQVEGITG
ncbi:DUF2254 domain-containing protein [Fulvivirga sediminis]|uniref:DUF2254 domain-containing protein n=1 Tax=Fulvivirga sediminis TaxID=2803949 RepID=A0A937F6Y6_9BACT|nr:DUF2254 domain-containing protein [Fulvivirga sediminis]MBL3655455.1 DUF2254 domain-containing protein [Fulvivirga sediminis]